MIDENHPSDPRRRAGVRVASPREDPARRAPAGGRACLRLRHRYLRDLQGPAGGWPRRERLARRPWPRQLQGRERSLPARALRSRTARWRSIVSRAREAEAPRPACLKGTLRDPRPLTDDVIAFEVELEGWLDFAAGQFVLLETPDVDGARAYSIAGSNRGGGRLTLVTKRRPGGRFGQWLFGGGADGAPLTVFGPLGRAVFVPSLQRHLLCLAGGTGIAGMLCILRRAADDGHFARFDAHLFFGVRAARDAFYLEELTTIRARHPGRITVTVALSDEEAPNHWLLLTRRWNLPVDSSMRWRESAWQAASLTCGPMSPARGRWWTRAFVCCSRWAACPLRRSVATDSTRAANSTTRKERKAE